MSRNDKQLDLFGETNDAETSETVFGTHRDEPSSGRPDAHHERRLEWVDPAECAVWEQHPRRSSPPDLESCRDLIDSLGARGRQHVPAIVRPAPPGSKARYEVICGARRLFTVSWLRLNRAPDFDLYIDVRNLNDEEAFLLADFENRDREDLTDFDRARSYVAALELFYDGHQSKMAARLGISDSRLSRHLDLGRLPDVIVNAITNKSKLKEVHARQLKPLLTKEKTRNLINQRAIELASDPVADGAHLVAHLKSIIGVARPDTQPVEGFFSRESDGPGIFARRTKNEVVLRFKSDLLKADFFAAIEAFAADNFGSEEPTE